MNYKTGKIFLIGGGSLKDGETDFIEKEILNSVNKKEINILMINYANSIKEDLNYLNKFREVYSNYDKYNVNIEQLSFFESFDNNVKIQKFKKADIIYFGGGNALKLKKALKKSNLFTDIFNGYLYNNKIIVGRSAGTLIFFEKFLAEKGINNSEIGLFNGFNVFKGICSVHLSEYNEGLILEKFVLNTRINGIGMDECTCLIIENGKFATLRKENKKIYKYSYGDKSIVINSIYNSNFIDINYLYY